MQNYLVFRDVGNESLLSIEAVPAKDLDAAEKIAHAMYGAIEVLWVADREQIENLLRFIDQPVKDTKLELRERIVPQRINRKADRNGQSH